MAPGGRLADGDWANLEVLPAKKKRIIKTGPTISHPLAVQRSRPDLPTYS